MHWVLLYLLQMSHLHLIQDSCLGGINTMFSLQLKSIHTILLMNQHRTSVSLRRILICRVLKKLLVLLSLIFSIRVHCSSILWYWMRLIRMNMSLTEVTRICKIIIQPKGLLLVETLRMLRMVLTTRDRSINVLTKVVTCYSRVLIYILWIKRT